MNDVIETLLKLADAKQISVNKNTFSIERIRCIFSVNKWTGQHENRLKLLVAGIFDRYFTFQKLYIAKCVFFHTFGRPTFVDC